MQAQFGRCHHHAEYEKDHYFRTFYSMGRLTANEGWDPVQFVNGTIELLSTNSQLISPSDLLHPRVVDRYRASAEEGKDLSTPKADWSYYSKRLIQELRLGSGSGASEFEILRCPGIYFPAWFRIVYPEKLNEELFATYGEEALQQFKRELRLRNFCRAQTPKVFSALQDRWGKFHDFDANGNPV